MPSIDVDKLMYLTGSSILRMKGSKGIAPGAYAALPTAGEEFRGAFVRTEGDSGSADNIAVCRKNADDEYEWVPLIVSVFYVGVDASSTFTNLAAGPTTVSQDDTVLVDVSQYRQVRMLCNVNTVGSAGSTAFLQYTTDLSAYSALTTDLIDLTASGFQATDWETIPAGAKVSPIQMRTAAQGGDGVADPNIRIVTAAFRT